MGRASPLYQVINQTYVVKGLERVREKKGEAMVEVWMGRLLDPRDGMAAATGVVHLGLCFPSRGRTFDDECRWAEEMYEQRTAR